MEPFALFALYYLGLQQTGGYKFVNANQVARLLNWSPEELLAHLKKHRMDPDLVVNTDFPLARHQIDFQMAALSDPPEMLRERAERIFAAFTAARDANKRRDWKGEIEREREEDAERRREASRAARRDGQS